VSDATDFPFSAVVGQDDLRLALVLGAVDPRIGGVLLRGEKGSAKTTVARALAALLPEGSGFVELPIGATEDRVVGTIDLRQVLSDGERRFSPGLLHAAHGGVLYVDEVNLLPDHLVDVLLDVAASGVNRVERDGVSETHPSRFVLIGSMNPEEGELRPQFLDRFGLSVAVTGLADPADRSEAIRRRLAFDADPVGFAHAWAPAEQALADRLAAARPVPLAPDLLEQVAELCIAMGVEGLRADLTVCRAAAALAGWEHRDEAGPEDVRRVAGFVLAHRLRRSPYDPPELSMAELHQRLEEVLGPRPPDSGAEGAADNSAGSRSERAAPGEGSGAGGPTGEDSGAGRPTGEGSGAGGPTGEDGAPGPTPDGAVSGAAAPEHIVPPAHDRPEAARLPEATRGTSSRATTFPRATTVPGRHEPVAGARGRLVGSQEPALGAPVGSISPTGTVAAAAARAGGVGRKVTVEAQDLRESVRVGKAGHLVVLAVDASGSMDADGRMGAAKDAVLALLVDAYQRRDRVALVTFRGEGATVVLRPTGSTEVARARLADLPTGGRTPLAAGIDAAAEVVRASGGGGYHPLVVLVSDGRATWAADGVDPVQASRRAAGGLLRQGIPAVVVDAEVAPEAMSGRRSGISLGLARPLAEAMGARYLALDQLSGEALAGVVRTSLTAR